MIIYALALCLFTTTACYAQQNKEDMSVIPTKLLVYMVDIMSKGSATNVNVAPPSAPGGLCTTTSVSQLYHSGKQSITNFHEALIAWAGEHKLFLTASIATTVYGTVVYWARSIDSYLHDENVWGNWQSNTPLAVLVQKPPTQLAEELIVDIERRYGNSLMNSFDGTMPLAVFVRALAQEKKTLLHLQKMYTYLSYVPYHATFGLKQELYTALQDRLARVAHYNTIINDWVAEWYAASVSQ